MTGRELILQAAREAYTFIRDKPQLRLAIRRSDERAARGGWDIAQVEMISIDHFLNRHLFREPVE